MSAHYLDARGCAWILVAETRAGKFGWFRPAAQPDDGAYDQHFRMDDMRCAQWVDRHTRASVEHAVAMRLRDPDYILIPTTSPNQEAPT